METRAFSRIAPLPVPLGVNALRADWKTEIQEKDAAPNTAGPATYFIEPGKPKLEGNDDG